MSLGVWGWSEIRQREFERIGKGTPARVVFQAQGIYRVVTAAGETQCTVRRSLTPVTGDWVDVDEGRGLITQILPRSGALGRKRPGRDMEEHVLAANVDVLFIVSALDYDFSLRRMERYLVVAEQGGASPVLVLNKQDQCPDPAGKLAEVEALTGRAVPAILTTALDAETTAQMHRFVGQGQTAALLGSSGVGKSTLVNCLLGEQVQATGAARAEDSKGRHTTSGRHLFPLAAGWLLIDTPGLREIEPWADATSVDAVFGDVLEVARDCRFRNCQHLADPGCAIQEAVAGGRLDAARVANFQNLRGAATEQERKRKATARGSRRSGNP